MCQTIETNQKFVFRTENLICIFLNIYLIPLGGFIFLFTGLQDYFWDKCKKSARQ